jgi:hypothetical protein
MKHPLTIIGSPGTILEIVNGNIICDFRSFKQDIEEEKIVIPPNLKIIGTICEVSLIFKCDPHKIVEKLKEYSLKVYITDENVGYSEHCL